MTEPKGIDHEIDQAIALIQRENWADRQMTTGERVAVNMAIRYVVDRLYPCAAGEVRIFTEDSNGRLFINKQVRP
jgi:hypothetical protein